MKNKNLLFGFLALVIAGSVVAIASSGISKQGKYTQRKEQNHKAAYGIKGAVEFLSKMRNNITTGDINPKWVNDAETGVENLKKSGNGKTLDLTWSELGPDNIGGRTRALLIDKNNPNIMYAGGVSGGLWKSNTGGSSWVALDDFSPSLAVSCIAQGADGTIYVGTGEGLGMATGAANGGTSFIGKGIFRSKDGVNFTLIQSTSPSAANSTSADWVYINRIACDPVNANRIYAATNKGLRSTDNATDSIVTWIWPIKLPNGNNNMQNATDVDVAGNGNVIAAIGPNPNYKCYFSDKGDEGTFKQRISGIPTSGISRMELAFAPSNPKFIYACLANSSDRKLNGIYRITDTDTNWANIGPGGSEAFQPLGAQGDYDNVIVVHPTNPNRIFVGGLDMWEGNKISEGAPFKWEQKSLWMLSRFSSYYIHADHHIYVFHPTNPDIIFIGSDGGVSRSQDCGKTFVTMNINYNTVQCYALSCSPFGWLMTGTQDNGTLYLPRLTAFPKHGYDILGGDGGWSAFSHINPEAFFGTTYYAGTRRSPDNGGNFYPSGDGSSPFFSNRMLGLGAPGDNFPAAFVTPLLMWESFNDTYSADSVVFTPDLVMNEIIFKFRFKDSTHLVDTLDRNGQSDASIKPSSISILSGSVSITDDGNGNLTGNNITGNIDYNTGIFDVNFPTAPANELKILATYKTKFDAGKFIIVNSNNNPAKFKYITTSPILYGDTVKIQDIVQAKFYLGANTGIWMTKQALRFDKQPEWFKVADINNSGNATQCLALSHDGNYLFVGTNNGRIYRVSNLRMAQDSLNSNASIGTNPNPDCVVKTKLLSTSFTNGRAVTSISVDPSDADKMVVTLGNYGESNYIYYTKNALDSIPTFIAKQGNLPKMPVYASIIPLFHSNVVIIGTEYGIFSTDNIGTTQQPVWNSENTGLANVPVYMLIQQKNLQYWNPSKPALDWTENYGTIYAGTHGRGIFECTKYTSIKEPDQPGTHIAVSAPLTVSLYPNPVVNNATISFTLPKTGNVKLNVYDMTGKLVKSADIADMTKGYHTYNFDCSSIKKGTYFIQLVSGNETASAKFVKMQ